VTSDQSPEALPGCGPDPLGELLGSEPAAKVDDPAGQLLVDGLDDPPLISRNVSIAISAARLLPSMNN
jgi:hypothetical protein